MYTVFVLMNSAAKTSNLFGGTILPTKVDRSSDTGQVVTYKLHKESLKETRVQLVSRRIVALTESGFRVYSLVFRL